VREIATPGQQITSIPVRFSASATVDTSAVGVYAAALMNARSSSSVPLAAPDLFDVRATTVEGSTPDFRQFDTVDVQETVNLVIDNINLVRVEASCTLQFDFDDDIRAACNVSESSGSFAFDQQAFDLAQGDSTFELSDFYAMTCRPASFQSHPNRPVASRRSWCCRRFDRLAEQLRAFDSMNQGFSETVVSPLRPACSRISEPESRRARPAPHRSGPTPRHVHGYRRLRSSAL